MIILAIVLLAATIVAWVRLALPHVSEAWSSFARDLDPTGAAQHATLFAPATTPTHPAPGHP